MRQSRDITLALAMRFFLVNRIGNIDREHELDIHIDTIVLRRSHGCRPEHTNDRESGRNEITRISHDGETRGATGPEQLTML